MKAIVTGFEAQHVSGPDEWAADDYLIGTIAMEFGSQYYNDCPAHLPPDYDAGHVRFGAAAFNENPTDSIPLVRDYLAE